jgi:hypothetical protein
VPVRVIDAEITAILQRQHERAGSRTGRYRLVTTLTDHRRYPAREVVALYHQRWEIETSFLEMKSTLLGGRVLRARTPAGVKQEIYALMLGYQALRLAIADALFGQDAPPDRGGFTVALQAARDQLIQASGVISGTVIDLVGVVGQVVRAYLLPGRRARVCPRVVKRAISKHRAKGRIDRTNYPARITVTILAGLATGQDP